MRTTPKKPDDAPLISANSSTQRGHMVRSMGRWWRPDWLSRDLLLLFGGRGLRSFAQAYLAIIVPIYLAQLGFNAEQLGILFTAAAVVSAALAASIGFFSDRFGRKTSLILISLLMAGGGVVFALTHNFLVLILAGALSTIGRGGGAGSGGAWGPYYPAEQALIAEHANDAQRTTVFGALSFVGVITGAVGSLLAAVPLLLHQDEGFSTFTGYQALFWLTAVLGIAMVLIVIPVHDEVRSRHAHRGVNGEIRQNGGQESRKEPAFNKAGEEEKKVLGLSPGSWSLIWRFMITNTTNGLAIGVLGPFVVYWFYLRYGVNTGELAGLFFVINLAAAIPYLLAGRLAQKLGAVNTVVLTRLVSVALLFVMVAMPTYLLASAVYLVRMIANTLSNPVRQSYLMGVIPARERASAAGLSNLPSQAAASISPYIAGYLIQTVSLNLPLEFAAIFQGINGILYYVFFRNVHPPEERAVQPVQTKT
jgi:MFS family permease